MLAGVEWFLVPLLLVISSCLAACFCGLKLASSAPSLAYRRHERSLRCRPRVESPVGVWVFPP